LVLVAIVLLAFSLRPAAVAVAPVLGVPPVPAAPVEQ
jgi:hypothetical protein